LLPYRLFYRLGVAPWERRPVAPVWQRIVDGSEGLAPGRALDVGCGSGRDAVHLAKHGWKVTGVDGVEEALAKARQRAAEEGVEVQWIAGDVSNLGTLGLEPGYTLLYDFGCIHGLDDSARASALTGLTELAAPDATLIILAFKRARRMILPQGMDREELIRLLGDTWELVSVESATDPSTPPPIRRAVPTLYRLRRKVVFSGGSAAAQD
jgi:SAM-dependent methyltransferase